MFYKITWAAITMGLASMVVFLWVQNNSLKYQMDTLAVQVESYDSGKQNVDNSNSIINLINSGHKKRSVFPQRGNFAKYGSIMERTTTNDVSYTEPLHINDSSSTSTTTRMLKGKGGTKKTNQNYYRSQNNGKGKGKGKGNGKNYYRFDYDYDYGYDYSESDKSGSFDSRNDESSSLRESMQIQSGKMKAFVRSLDSELIGLSDETSTLMSLVIDLDNTVLFVGTDEEGVDRSSLPGNDNGDNNRALEQKSIIKQQAQDIAITDAVVARRTNTVENMNDNVKDLSDFDIVEPIAWEMQLNHTLVALTEQRELLSSGNARISNVNMLLQTSTSDLIFEVQRLRLLEAELSDNVNNFKDENAELSASVVDLNEQNQIMNESNKQYAASNSELSKMVRNLKDSVDDLSSENLFFTEHNRELKIVTIDLKNETDRLVIEVNDLTRQREQIQSTVGDLSIENSKLSASNINLADRISDLQNEVNQLSNATSRLETANDELKTVVGFLDETADNLDASYEATTLFLSQQIVVYRAAVIGDIKNTYYFRLTNWDCGYRDFFGDPLEFGADFDIPIPDQILKENVLDYIGARVLDDMCLEMSDFSAYLFGNADIAEVMNTKTKMTTNQLMEAVHSYVEVAMDYYFPYNIGNKGTQERAGLTDEDWAAAAYDCQNLADGKKFLLSPVPVTVDGKLSV